MTASPTPQTPDTLRQQIVAKLRTIFDPEIPVNIYDLGLVYGVDISDENDVHVRMTLTTPACPVAVTLPPQVEAVVRAIPGVREARVEVVWDPPWTKDLMSEAAKLTLNLDLDSPRPGATARYYDILPRR